MMKKSNKKVLIFLVWYGMGGSTLYISQYVTYLVKNGYRVFVVCRKPDKGSFFLKQIGAIPIYVHFPFALNFTALDEFNNTVKKRIIDFIKLVIGFFLSLYLLLIYKPKIVIIGEFCEIPVLLSASLFRNKTICLFQTSISRTKWKRIILFHLLKSIDHLVGITPLHTTILPFKDKINIVPNILISTNNTSKSIEINNLTVKDSKVIFFMGGISRTKGTHYFVEIALELLKLRNDLCFIIAGNFHKRFKTKLCKGSDNNDFYYNEIIFTRIGDLLDKKFIFLGEIIGITEVLKMSDLLMSTNIYPHFSRPIVEAYANKIPVAANLDTYTKYMCHNKESILLIDNMRTVESARLINVLLNSKMHIEKQIFEGYNNYKKYYSQEVAENALAKLFLE